MAALDAYDELIETSLNPLKDTAGKIGGDVNTLTEHVAKAFRAQREYLEIPPRFLKPDDKLLAELLKPTSDAIQDTTKFIEATLKRTNPRTDSVNHLQAISNSISALGWVTVAPAPTQFVTESGVNSAQFYLNKVLKDAKDDLHKQWCKQVTQLWQELANYVKAHHRTGVAWNPKGERLTSAAGARASPARTSGAAPPPPPPPGALPPPPPPVAAGGADALASAKADLFAQISVGGAVTSGLKKVADKDRVCKNPELRAGSRVPELKGAASNSAKTSGPGCGNGPAILELRNEKEWRIENQKGAQLELDAARVQRNHAVYVYRSENTVIQVPAKVNVIQIDSCRKVKLFVDEVIGAIDVVNCLSIEVHVLVKGRLVNIDKTDGAQVFLLAKDKTPEAQELLEQIEVITSKTSTVNICTPDTRSDAVDGDYVESPVSEQFRTTKKKIERVDKSGEKKVTYVWKTEPAESVG